MEVRDEQLIELLEGGSNPELEQEIEKNPSLQKRYFELKEVLDAIEHSSQPEVPLHIHEAVKQAIFEEQASMEDPSYPTAHQKWTWRGCY